MGRRCVSVAEDMSLAVLTSGLYQFCTVRHIILWGPGLLLCIRWVR